MCMEGGKVGIIEDNWWTAPILHKLRGIDEGFHGYLNYGASVSQILIILVSHKCEGAHIHFISW